MTNSNMTTAQVSNEPTNNNPVEQSSSKRKVGRAHLNGRGRGGGRGRGRGRGPNISKSERKGTNNDENASTSTVGTFMQATRHGNTVDAKISPECDVQNKQEVKGRHGNGTSGRGKVRAGRGKSRVSGRGHHGKRDKDVSENTMNPDRDEVSFGVTEQNFIPARGLVGEIKSTPSPSDNALNGDDKDTLSPRTEVADGTHTNTERKSKKSHEVANGTHTNNERKSKKRNPKHPKRHVKVENTIPPAEVEVSNTVDAGKELVTNRKNRSIISAELLGNCDTPIPPKEPPSAKVIDLLKHKKHHTTGHRDHKDAHKKFLTKKKVKKKPGVDIISKQRAAKAFNLAVKKCVEKSDPDGLYDLLHDRNNHEFGLSADVLETVLKALVVAAMFDEALYCLRNCTKPGTLSNFQTEQVLQCLPQNLRNSSSLIAADMISALCIATEFDKPTHRTYFIRIVRGIALEFFEEAINARDRICSIPCERLVRSSFCIVDAKIRRGKKATDLVVIPGNQLGVFIPDSMENRGIQAGDAVGILPYASPYPMSAESLDRNLIEATVTGMNPMVLRLQDKTNSTLYDMLTEDVEGNVYRIDKLANRMVYNRQLSAVVAIASPLEKILASSSSPQFDMKRPSPELIRAITAMDENIDLSLINGDVNRHQRRDCSKLTSTAELCAQAVPFFVSDESGYDENGDKMYYDQESIRDQARLALSKYGSFEGLNASQRLAVEGAVTNRLTLIQGPPGTGKTVVAIRIMQYWARLAESEALPGEQPKPILATSDSNIAVDNLVEGCANAGLVVVRLGRPESIRPDLLRFCIDRPRNSGESYGSIYQEKLHSLKNAQIICCTCIGSGADILDNMSFERVLVDEATQATEPAVLVPLTRSCRQLVLVGDHCQLPPTVLSTRASEEGLGVPLFSRMVACGVPPYMLDTQYRMHPGIAMFPSDLFYGGKLISGVTAPERRPLLGFPWPREEFPVAFVPVPHGIEIDDGVSKANEAEAEAVCHSVSLLLEGGQCGPQDIAVVTPYAAQVRLVRRLTKKLVSGPPYIEVSSTDGFQGREKEAVVFSAVRSNDYGTVGFVSDWRRVNVSFTRARRALIVIGNDATLRRGDPDTWMPWLAWADAHGINMDKPGITRGRYDAEQLRRVRGGTTAAEMLKEVLERQQAQLKTASKQLERAEKKTVKHVMGEHDDGEVPVICEEALKEDLAQLSKTDGLWDDSDHEDNGEMHHSASAATFVTSSSMNTKEETIQDAWDL